MLKSWIYFFADSIPSYWGIILLSAVPVTELRGSIPLAVAMGFDPWVAFYLALIGNFIPVIPLLLILGPAIHVMKNIPWLGGIIEKILIRTKSKSERIEKFGALGLILFVGIPAPGTGVWSGVLLAHLLGVRFLYAVFAISAGMIIAGILVTLATLGVLELTTLFSAKTTLLLCTGVLLLIYWKFFKRKK